MRLAEMLEYVCKYDEITHSLGVPFCWWTNYISASRIHQQFISNFFASLSNISQVNTKYITTRKKTKHTVPSWMTSSCKGYLQKVSAWSIAMISQVISQVKPHPHVEELSSEFASSSKSFSTSQTNHILKYCKSFSSEFTLSSKSFSSEVISSNGAQCKESVCCVGRNSWRFLRSFFYCFLWTVLC